MELLFRKANRSPLLLAFIFCTFFHNVLSIRHKIRHYKDRFKRQQGANLYLPESYVTEGGGEDPEQGPWSDWTEPSPCSRTCGGGVSTQFRQCNEGYSCSGASRRHFSCNTQDCPDTGDFRAQQCSEYDEIPFENVKYQWVPYTKGPNPCELNCMPKGQRFYYQHAPHVIDGTRCNDENLDVCVNGKCQPVGCDMMLGSNLMEDNCRICGGDGSTCNTISNTLQLDDLKVGYNDILLIPSGATNILVYEVAPSNNYLAIRNTSGHYYLNGNWRIDFPRTIEFAGSKFHYDRSPQGFAAPDKVFALGPIEEAIFIVLLYQDSVVPVEYKYSLPTNVQPGSESETYAWTFDQYSQCTVTCGGGVQHRNVSCAGRKTLDPVDEKLCDEARKPETSRKCNEVACEADWIPHPWGNCSVPCGKEGGVQTREISCQQVVSNGYPSLVDESECHGPKPPQQQKCNEGVTCATWHTGPWKPCDHLCGDGRQTRSIHCFIKDEDNKIQILDESKCEIIEKKPAAEQNCFNRPCEGVDWITSEWSGCDSICGLNNETRKIFCATDDGQIYSDNLCDENTKPESVQQCKGIYNETCNYLWYASQWSECSTKCGKGIQTRSLFCGVATKEGVKKVENDQCDQSKTFDIIKNCTGTEECDGEWFSGPWGECSKACGGGEKTKKVVCIKGNELVDISHCNADKIIFSHEDCNKQPCTEDSVLPVDKTTPLKLQEKEETTTETITTYVESDESLEPAESTRSNTDLTEKESEITASDIMLSSDVSELTKSFEFTTEPQAEESDKKESEDEYEIVPSDSCDDGEWVEVVGVVVDKETESTEEIVESTTLDTTKEFEDFSSSLSDLMMSDGTSISETLFTGSGDEESTSTIFASSIEPEEGSGNTTPIMDMETSTTGLFSTSSELGEVSTVSELSTTMGATSELFESSSVTELSTFSTEGTTGASEESDGTTVGISSEATSSFSTTDTESTTVDVSTTESLSTTESSTTVLSTITTEISESSSTQESTTDSSTSDTSESSTTEEFTSTSTESVTTESTESSTYSTDSSGITESIASTETAGSTESTTVVSTETFTEFSTSEQTSESGSTEVTTLSGSTESGTEATSEFSSEAESTSTSATEESTSVFSTTEVSGSTEYSTEISGSTEFDIFSSTSESSETTTWPFTPVTDIFKKKQRMCKRKKILQCKNSTYGCCWDNIHVAEGPFDKGCPAPKTCKESSYGCCPDGVSAALGEKNRGCPSSHCNETLFGCCWDKKTPAEGNDEEGCPPKPPACTLSKWGCCKDNITEAKGPKQKGCEPEKDQSEKETTLAPTTTTTSVSTEECKKTDYGCCPDGNPAKGPQLQGCNIPCGNSTFGCCPDKETPAHGYRGEGCCLTSAFGCCSDNLTPASSANGDGCDCKSSSYGCCPDQSTPAQGYNNEGCGCEYSQHGCCPDDVTTASGPDFEGCLCHTFQFGCCPNGVSVAQGPHQQGCDCRSSEFGCCSDEKTHAKGPNEEGCTCDLTKYGCCLDGLSKAQGENFEGCEEMLVDHQAACSLPNDRGSCRNYTVKWYFDMNYGGCSRFWYGGCDGNDNRFKTKEECEGICVKPLGIERCNLPRVNGSCEGYFLQWYYDRNSRQCSQFVYGGCLGNNNRFENREECAQLCSKDEISDPCEQSKSEGPCRGQHRRYFFEKDSGQCQEFIYGGCRGNNNNFISLEACKQRCATPGKKRDYCTIPKAEGNCTAREARWYYGVQEQNCLPFYYTGCGGNKNSFYSKDACNEDCPKEVAKNTCHLPADIGECGNYVTRWYWDTKFKRCNQFYYGGCGGNSNNFHLEEDCKQECTRESVPPPSPPIQSQTQRPLPTPQVPEPTSKQFTYDEICSTSPDAGPCTDHSVRYYYDGSQGVCKNFTYGGCGGNYNNFETEDTCLQYCGSTRYLPPVIPPQTVTTKMPPVSAPLADFCYESFDYGNCTNEYAAFYYDSTIGACAGFTYSGCGGNNNRFYTDEDCQRRCGLYRGQDVCNIHHDAGSCSNYEIKYYFDRDVKSCRQFYYGGCEGNGNRFSTIEECQQLCGPRELPKSSLSPAEICQLPADQGSCPDLNHKRWYFDNTEGECRVFIFSNCGGNLNNFISFQSCLDFCKDFLPYTNAPHPDPGVAPSECKAKFDECSSLRCPYGIEAYVDENECNGCRCRNPCKDTGCPEGTQCAIDLNRNRTTSDDPDFVAICRETNKSGKCPYISRNVSSNCDTECKTDAECVLNFKCCSTECGTVCVEPEKPLELFTQTNEPAYTVPSIEDIYYAPKIDVQIFEPEVNATIGDQAILNCAVSGNPNPKIAWSKNNLVIDGTQPRYRIRLDQTLQIITLHNTDSGIYLCTADNGIGAPIQNRINLQVTETNTDHPVYILNERDPELLVSSVITSLGAPATLHCYALGWPLPGVTWFKGDDMIPMLNREFEIREDFSLIIHSVQLTNLGVYTCQAYNGRGKAASWSVTVKAKGPIVSSTNPEDIKYLQYVISDQSISSTTAKVLPSTSPITQSYSSFSSYSTLRPWYSSSSSHYYWNYSPVQRPTPQPFIPPPLFSSSEPNPALVNNEIYPSELPDAAGYVPDSIFTVPVRANITTNELKYPTGSKINIDCDVYGYPPPQVEWYKDGISLYSSEKISISENHTLTINAADKSDSGRYQCEAKNPYSKSSSTLDILVEGLFIHPSCKDNKLFADCRLIVKAQYCNHRYYRRFCCRSCTEAGQLPMIQENSIE